MQHEKHISQLIVRSILGTLDDQGRQELDTWLAADTRHRELLEELSRPATLEQHIAELQRIDRHKAQTMMEQRIREAESRKQEITAPKRHHLSLSRSYWLAGIAAMGEGSSQWINAGEMENKGVEFNFGYRNNTRWGLKYDITGNIGTYRNKITKLPETIASKGTFGGSGVKSVVGHPINSYVGYIYDGIFKSQEEVDNHATQEGAAVGRMRFKDIDGNGIINEADQDWIYDPTPDFTYGLNIYLQYKNFDFTMFWQGVQGVDALTTVKPGDDTNGGYKVQTDLWAGVNVAYLNKGDRVLDAWTPANYGSNIPALSLYDNNNEKRFSSYYVENGSYLKLRTIQLGYNLPKSLTEKLHITKIRTYVSAQNLLTIKSKKFTGVDPENPLFGYPIPLNVTFGFNVSF